MNTKYINTLIDRYYAGDTSLEEERQLKDFFAKENVPTELKEHQSLFQGLSGIQNEGLSANFEAKLFQQLEEEKPSAKVFKLRSAALRIAAAVVLLLGLWFLIPDNQSSGTTDQSIDWTAYEVSEEQSVEEALAALRLLSEKLNNGKKKVSTEMNNVDKLSRPF